MARRAAPTALFNPLKNRRETPIDSGCVVRRSSAASASSVAMRRRAAVPPRDDGPFGGAGTVLRDDGRVEEGICCARFALRSATRRRQRCQIARLTRRVTARRRRRCTVGSRSPSASLLGGCRRLSSMNAHLPSSAIVTIGAPSVTHDSRECPLRSRPPPPSPQLPFPMLRRSYEEQVGGSGDPLVKTRSLLDRTVSLCGMLDGCGTRGQRRTAAETEGRGSRRDAMECPLASSRRATMSRRGGEDELALSWERNLSALWAWRWKRQPSVGAQHYIDLP